MRTDRGGPARDARPDEEEAARAAYATTHGGRAPDRMLREKVECAAGEPLVALGRVLAVEYGPTDKGLGPSIYRHVFEGTRQPTLAVNARSGKLHFVGGAYDITHEGVEDLPVERAGPPRPPTAGEEGAAGEAARAYERLHGAPPERVQAVPLGARCGARSLAALGPLVAVEWREGGVTRRHELRGSDAQLAFDTDGNDLHVVGSAYTVRLTGETRTMAQNYYDDPYAVVANPDIYGGGNPHMRANPGYLLERDELPAEQHAPHIVVGGTLIAGLLGAAVVALVEYGPRALPEAMRSYGVRTAMRALGIAAGVGIAFRYPVIGSAVAGASAWKLAEGVLDNFAWGPMTLAPGAGEAPAAGLEAGGVWQPYPTGAHRAAA